MAHFDTFQGIPYFSFHFTLNFSRPSHIFVGIFFLIDCTFCGVCCCVSFIHLLIQLYSYKSLKKNYLNSVSKSKDVKQNAEIKKLFFKVV